MANIGRLLKKKKAPRPDEVSNKVVKLVDKVNSELLLQIFNAFLHQGIFFESWKRQKLILLKKGNKPLDEPTSFRSICRLDTLGKVETLILQRFQYHLMVGNALADNQST